MRAQKRLVAIAGNSDSFRSEVIKRCSRAGWAVVGKPDEAGPVQRQLQEQDCARALLSGREVVVDASGLSNLQRSAWVALARICDARLIGVQVGDSHAVSGDNSAGAKPSVERRAGEPGATRSPGDEASPDMGQDFIALEPSESRPVGLASEDAAIRSEELTLEEGFDELHHLGSFKAVKNFSSSLGQAAGQIDNAASYGLPKKVAEAGPVMDHDEAGQDWMRPYKRGIDASQLDSSSDAYIHEAPSDMESGPQASEGDHELNGTPHGGPYAPTARRISAKAQAKHPSMRRSRVGQEPSPQIPLDVRAPQRPHLRNGMSAPDLRPILLFDLNGTLTSHTAQRRSSGITHIRPGIHHLRRLQEGFRLGIFSSATDRTVATVLPRLEEAAGPGAPLFDDALLILHRGHTEHAPEMHVTNGGNHWDTVKPLCKFFARLHRVLLVDDDAYKAIEGEEHNMVLVPTWQDNPYDDCLSSLCAHLHQRLTVHSEADLRQLAPAITEAVAHDCQSKARYQRQQPAQSLQ